MSISSIGQPNVTVPATGNQGPAQVAEVGTAPHRCDPNGVEFKVMLEVKANANTVHHALSKVPGGWSAVQCPSDCSHRSGWGDVGESAYTRISSPIMRFNNGAEQQIAQALAAVSGIGATPGLTGAMHIYVQTKDMDDTATNNFMKMTRHNEDILYRLGQQGGPGRAMNNKVGYANQITRQAEQNGTMAWARTLQSYYNGVNSYFSGFWQLRYFDSTLDPKQATAAMKLVCGMVAAAKDGRGQWNEIHAADVNVAPAPERKRWNAFMREVAPPELRGLYESNFRAVGCQLPPGLDQASEGAVRGMMSRSCVFSDPTGNALDVAGVNAAIENETPVTIRNGQSSVTIPASQVTNYAYAENGQLNNLPPAVRDRINQAVALRTKGVEIRGQDGQPMSPSLIGISDPAVPLVASRAGETVTLNDRFTLAMLNNIENEGASQLKPETRQFLQSELPELTKGSSLIVDGQPSNWPARIAAAFDQGSLQVESNGTRSAAVGSLAALEQNVKVPQRLAGLSAEDRATCEQAAQLAKTRGFAFKVGDQSLAPDTVAFIDGVLSGHEGLSVQVPNGKHATPLPNPSLRDMFINIECGHDDRLDARTRQQIALIDGLKARGFRFHNVRAEGDVNTRSGGPLALQTDGQRLLMTAPGSQRMTRITPRTLNIVSDYANGQTDKIDAGLMGALSAATELRANQFGFERHDPAKLESLVPCNDVEMLATLARNKEIVFVDPAQNRTPVTGVDGFNAEVARVKQVGSLTPEQQADMARLGTLLGSRISARSASTGQTVTTPALVPWHLGNNHGGFVVAAGGSSAGTTSEVTVADWNKLHSVLDVETRADSLPPTTRTILDNLQTLRTANVSIKTVAAQKGSEQPVALDSAALDRLQDTGATGGLKLSLPRMTIWNYWPRKNIVVQSSDDLARLAAKFAPRSA